ncbi:MAG: hypothetical protein IOD12_01500 [Silvanigrellales bacterium]|nr:hypothetical protein [Silvanigrellales bacterium]
MKRSTERHTTLFFSRAALLGFVFAFAFQLHVACKPKASAPNAAPGQPASAQPQLPPVTQMPNWQQPAAPPVNTNAAQATGCANPVREEMATPTMLKCCVEKGYGQPTTACQESVSKCWANDVWAYLGSLTNECTGQATAGNSSDSEPFAEPDANEPPADAAPSAWTQCAEMYKLLPTGKSEMCRTCYSVHATFESWCDRNGVNRDGSTYQAPASQTNIDINKETATSITQRVKCTFYASEGIKRWWMVPFTDKCVNGYINNNEVYYEGCSAENGVCGCHRFQRVNAKEMVKADCYAAGGRVVP